MKYFKVLFLIGLIFSGEFLFGQLVNEFPPYVQPTFSGIPLDGGRVFAVTTNPTNANQIIFSTPFGGLWITEDGGTNWGHINSLEAVQCNDVVFGADGLTLIATLPRDNESVNGGGIYVSHNAGLTWEKPPTADPPINGRTVSRASAQGISFAPDDPSKVYVGTTFGVAISTDKGYTWNHQMLENSSRITPDSLQNSIYSIQALPNNKVVAAGKTGVYRSDDGGSVWTNIRTGDFTSWDSFKMIDVSPYDFDKVFILQHYWNLSLYEVSTGQWTNIPVPGGSSRTPFVRISKSSFTTSNFDIWVGAGVTLQKITCTDIDSAKRINVSGWLTIARGNGIHDDVGYLGLDNNKLPLLLGSDGGIFKPTNDEGTRWTRAALPNSGLNSYQITDLDGTDVPVSRDRFSRLSTRYNTSLYFSTQDNGLWASSDGGITWPFSDCCEGYHIELRRDAPNNSSVTVAYGSVGSGSSGHMFSDAHFQRRRNVPNVDDAGNTLTDMTDAFFISPNNYLRFRLARNSNPEIYVSQNNGNSWRRIATVALEIRGIPITSGPGTNPTIYIPFRGARTAPGNRERIGLLKLTDVYATGVRNYSDANLIYLPGNGSLGIRATEFDWHAIFAVDPNNANHIIAPDIINQVVRVSTNGGSVWLTETTLTNEVTKNRRYLLYDQHPYRMFITEIMFDPHDSNRILIGTREGGIIISRDGGHYWNTIRDSELIPYITGFYVKRDNTAVVSSYGRGLWTVDLKVYPIEFPHFRYCRVPCILRLIRDSDFYPDPITWLDKEVIIFTNGRINGLDLSGERLKMLSVTPGTNYHRFVGKTKYTNDLNIVEDAKGTGFIDLKGCLIAEKKGEVIKGLIIENGNVVAMITGKSITEESEISGLLTPEDYKESVFEKVKSDEIKKEKVPYLFVSTEFQSSGIPMVGTTGMVEFYATGFNFDENNAALIAIDNIIIDKVNVEKGGIVRYSFKSTDELTFGEHTVQITQPFDGKELIAVSSFAKTKNIDAFEK